MEYICRICKQKVTIRVNFSDRHKKKYPKYHLSNGYVCHGFFEEVITFSLEN